MECPLCSSQQTSLETSMSVAELVARWKKDANIDVSAEFGNVTVVEYYKCHECALGFFRPDSVAGSPALYEKLENREGYYLPRKWEHDAALQDLDGSHNGLEIGCGLGAFVARVNQEKGIHFEGCEQNPSAVKIGQANGIPIRLETIEELIARTPRSYDAVCSFQVLEHVVNPGDFISKSCELLRPGGKLIMGLPNAKSYIKHIFNIFDAPPHHMTRWSNDILIQLPRWFPLKLERIAYEPLPEYRVAWYVEVYDHLLRRYGFGLLLHPWIISRTMRVLKRPGIRRFLRGDTIYACYVRT